MAPQIRQRGKRTVHMRALRPGPASSVSVSPPVHPATPPALAAAAPTSVVVSWSLMYRCSHCTTSSCCWHPSSCRTSSSCGQQCRGQTVMVNRHSCAFLTPWCTHWQRPHAVKSAGPAVRHAALASAAQQRWHGPPNRNSPQPHDSPRAPCSRRHSTRKGLLHRPAHLGIL